MLRLFHAPRDYPTYREPISYARNDVTLIVLGRERMIRNNRQRDRRRRPAERRARLSLGSKAERSRERSYTISPRFVRLRQCPPHFLSGNAKRGGQGGSRFRDAATTTFAEGWRFRARNSTCTSRCVRVRNYVTLRYRALRNVTSSEVMWPGRHVTRSDFCNRSFRGQMFPRDESGFQVPKFVPRRDRGRKGVPYSYRY